MYFFRALIASLLSLVYTLTVSTFVTLQTINDTVLNRTETKTWLAASGTYDRLLPAVLAHDSTAQQQIATVGAPTLQQATQNALVQTFPTSFVQQSSERVLDGVYNWLDSKQPNIQFEINTTTYKEGFIKNLTLQLEPALTALPRCTSLAQFNTSNPSCLPPGTTAAQAAETMATTAAHEALIFTQPITTDNYNKFVTTTANETGQPTPAQPSQQVPRAVSIMRQWLLWLPFIALASGLLMVLLSQHKLKAGKHLAGRLTVGLALTCGIGLVVAYFGQTLSIGDYVTSTKDNAILTEIGEPILHQAAPAIGYHLAWVSGIMGVITLIAWIVLRIIKKRNEHADLTTSDQPSATVPATPASTPAQPAVAEPKKPSKPANP